MVRTVLDQSSNNMVYKIADQAIQITNRRNIFIYRFTQPQSKQKHLFLYKNHIHSGSISHISLDSCTGKDTLKREHILPLLMEKFCPVFNYANCSFAV